MEVVSSNILSLFYKSKRYISNYKLFSIYITFSCRPGLILRIYRQENMMKHQCLVSGYNGVPGICIYENSFSKTYTFSSHTVRSKFIADKKKSKIDLYLLVLGYRFTNKKIHRLCLILNFINILAGRSGVRNSNMCKKM